MYEKVLLALTLLSSLGVLDPSPGSDNLAYTQLTQAELETKLSSALNITTDLDVLKTANVTIEENISRIPEVPFYSQLDDISSPTWQKVGCGIASLAMLIDYYQPGGVDLDTLLAQGINAGAYLHNVGWTYKGLIGVSNAYGLTGQSFDLGGNSMDTAFKTFAEAVNKGPVIASVHYTFEPTNPIPHLVVVKGIKDGFVYYNDPALHHAGGTISVSKFQSAWKKRYIEFWPVG